MKYIIANWKMNMDLENLTKWVAEFSEFQNTITPNIEVIIAPSFIHIPFIFELPQKNLLKLSSQDSSSEGKGAHTGDVGAFQIKEFCKYAIIGHSERKESKKAVVKKRDLILKEGVMPIICFINPKDLRELYSENCVFAWEDPKSISKNGIYNAKSTSEIEKSVKEIRKKIPEHAVLLYGGSVNENNIKGISKIEKLDGVLVGNASLEPKTFADIIRAYSQKSE
jgi:triosephosphate isomerase